MSYFSPILIFLIAFLYLFIVLYQWFKKCSDYRRRYGKTWTIFEFSFERKQREEQEKLSSNPSPKP